MKKNLFGILCLMLALSLILSGCGLNAWSDYLWQLNETILAFSADSGYEDMVYTRPDMAALEQTLEKSCETCRTATNIRAVTDAVFDFYDCFDDFHTNMMLAHIRYSTDLRDTYWEAEYDYCAQNAATVNAGLEELYCALAQSPLRETLDGEDYFGPDFLKDYEGESIWDEELLALMEKEAQLEGRYYEVMGEQTLEDYEAFYDAQYDTLAQLLVELVRVRNQIAEYMGWESYPEFAYEFYHQRDFVPAEAKNLMKLIQRELVPLYCRLCSEEWEPWEDLSCTQQEMTGYVSKCAKAMGGDAWEAWNLMEDNGLWEIEPGEYKLNASFEVFLPSYQVPFVFVNPTQTQEDKLILAHEFGHFVQDYVRAGNYTSTDVAEVLSQGMEYLSLCLCEDTQELTRRKMADGLAVYVEQSAFACFEQQLYELEEEELTAENIRSIYSRVAVDFGFDSLQWDDREYVMLNHIYTEPMYLISYVVSNDAAFQLYEMEQTEPGSGVRKYLEMPYSEEAMFCGFVESMGLERIFTQTRIPEVRVTLEEILFP